MITKAARARIQHPHEARYCGHYSMVEMDLEAQLRELPGEDALEQARVLARLQARMFGRAAAPARVGPYEILAPLGAGAAGLVYRAHDPKLQREVAIKLLQPRGEQRIAAQRLLREAHILARIAHPNVVGVFDVGTIDDRVYVVMELVDGPTLDQWVTARRSDWREVVRLYRAVGEGLAAVHRAGMLHRDFKPTNVIVDKEGRPKLADFGLARVSSSGASTREDLDDGVTRGDGGPGATDALTSLTDGREFIGTPAYMAPEQLAGRPADAASDQFAFCVALHESLFGCRPFAGDSLESLTVAVTAGPQTIGAGTRDRKGVPRWLRRVLLRGLSPDREQRWPSMDALLRELGSGQARVRRRWMSLGGGSIMAALASVPLQEKLEHERAMARCDAEGAAIHESAWNADVAERLRVSLQGPGGSSDTYDRIEGFVEQYVRDWQQRRTQACIAADVEQSWDAALAQQSAECFDERREGLEALLDVLAEGGEHTARRAMPGLLGLPRPAACVDVTALARRPQLPITPALRARARELVAAMIRGESHGFAGNYEAALEVFRAVHDAADDADLLWLRLRAAVELGYYAGATSDSATAEKLQRDALVEAGAAGFDETAANAALGLLRTLTDLARYDEALVIGDVATLFVRRLEASEGLLGAQLADALGRVHRRRGAYDDAERLHRQALTTADSVLGPDHPDLHEYLNALAVVHLERREHADALALFERALSISERVLGATHPQVAPLLNNMAATRQMMGDYDGAIPLVARALDITRETFGPKHPSTATCLANLGSLHQYRGEYDAAEGYQREAIAVLEKIHGPDHVTTAEVVENLAHIHRIRGEYAEAERLFRRVLGSYEAALGANNESVARGLENLARVVEDRDEARALALRAVALYEQVLGADHPASGIALQVLAREARARGDLTGAMRLNRRRFALAEKNGDRDHPEAGSALADIADDLLRLGELDEAEKLFTQALSITQKALGEDHVDCAKALHGLGKLALARRRPADAIAPLEQAVRLREKSRVEPGYLAETRFTLAHALWDARVDRPRAVLLARAALATFASRGPRSAKRVAAVQRWLRRHRA